VTYGQSLVDQGRQAIIANYQSKAIAYARGTQDKGDDSSSCGPFTTGGNRHERFFNFIKAFPASCANPSGTNCDTVDLVNMGHDAGGMMAAPAGQARLFTDNFYGNGNRSYDFGYPRLESWDDPFPNPALNSTTSSVNNNTYAGNLTYGGCYSDTGSTRALDIMAYDNSANTIEMCTDTCVSKGYTIAGLEFGSQCYCGKQLKAGTTKVIENSCTTACSGNSTEICGNNNRLSVFSNGTPYILAPASSPDTVGNFSYTNCYTDTSPRTLSGKFISGSFMTLDYCANYCSGYKYFGTEYSSECYCGNTINAAAKVATATDCSYTCANNTSQYCGAGSRLTLYTNPNAADVPASSSTGTASTPSASAGTGPSCPASDGTVVASNGLNFTVECGIDHAGGDLTSLYVGSFQECIDACSSNSKCVDVSLSGTACYLKQTLGSANKSPSIWGAKLTTGGASSSVSSTVSSSAGSSASQSSTATSVSGQTSSVSSTVTSSSATTTPSNLACPSSDAITYVGASGRDFVIECGIDHQGGDMGSKYVDSFQACIDACDQTAGCVDVSLSGSACYMKSSLGPAVAASYVLGARLVVSSSSSASSSTTATGSSSVLSSSSSVSSTASQSSSSVSSSVSATATAVSCPTSDGTTYTLASGGSFLIECGIDHQGGDLTSTPVKSFAECIAACDTTANCVDVSLSGDMCYLKSSVGAAVKASYISGAKRFAASSSSSLSTVVSSTSSLSSSLSSSTSGLTSSTGTSSSSVSSANTDTTTASSSGLSSSQQSLPTSSDSSLSSSTTTSSSQSSLSSSITTSSSSESSILSSTTQSSQTSVTQSQTTSTSTSTDSLSSATSQSTPSVTSSSSTETTATTSSTGSSSVTSSSSSSESSSSILSTSASSSSLSSSSSSSTLTSSATTLSTAVSSSTIASSSTVSTAASLPSGFSYAGCFIDSSSARALPVQIGTSTTQTPQQCAMSCQTKGYKYSGTEYANECWCGNSAPTNQATESQCNMACKGDSTQKCGAGSRLSVVSDDSWKQTFFATQNSGPWNLLGCYTDSTAKRSLPSSVSLAAYGGGANATIANCMSACKARGFSYCGAEYYSECYGSNTAPATSMASGSDPLSAGCNYPCKGNSSESCGGSSRIIVYSTNLA
jgi:hypothetical protein